MEGLEVAREGAVALVTLNRPEVRNAFNEGLIAALHETFVALDRDPEVRIVVFGAQGPAFCAGADLNWMKKMAGYTFDENEADALCLADMLHAIDQCAKPVIARVHGDVYAGGMGLVAACDIAVASTNAQFCLSETRLGLIPATIGPYVIRALGEQAARRYVLSAERFDAAEAYRLGFIHELVQPDELDERVGELVDALLLCSPQALAAAKRLVREVGQQPVTPSLRADTARRIAEARASEEGREGVKAFLEKRKPRWVRGAQS